jgi:hypothetical protein
MAVELALVALLLGARPDIHGAAELGTGVGVPFSAAKTSFQLSVRAHVELTLAPWLAVGIVAPIGFAFFSGPSLPVPVSYQVLDLLPGPRARLKLTEWLSAAVELGIGPSVFGVQTFVPIFGAVNDTHLVLATRAAIELELSPPAVEGFVVYLEPAAVYGRFSEQAFSDFRCAVGVGYRR